MASDLSRGYKQPFVTSQLWPRPLGPTPRWPFDPFHPGHLPERRTSERERIDFNEEPENTFLRSCCNKPTDTLTITTSLHYSQLGTHPCRCYMNSKNQPFWSRLLKHKLPSSFCSYVQKVTLITHSTFSASLQQRCFREISLFHTRHRPHKLRDVLRYVVSCC